MPINRRISVILAMNDEGNRKKLAGIFDYIRTTRPWDVTLVEPSAAAAHQNSRPDGIIAGEWPFHAARFAKVPKVIMHTPKSGIPNASYVTCDENKIITEAVRLLRRNGFSSIAYLHDQNLSTFSRNRATAFSGRVWPEPGFTSLADWLRALPQRTAIIAANDMTACEAMLKCRTLGIEIPRDLAFVGIDNTDLLCETCPTALTSIEPDFRRGGYLAARQMDLILAGESPSAPVSYYGVRRVVERASSRYMARRQDPRIAVALDFIREHATEPIGVADVAKTMGVARRTAEYIFQHSLRKSVGKMIHLARLDAMMKMVKESSRTNSDICALSGFASESHAKHAFKTRFGKPMSAFRSPVQRADQPSQGKVSPST